MVITIISERIRTLREQTGITHADLVRQLHVTRSGVNAWEQGISVPSAQLSVESAETFPISAYYLPDLKRTASVGVEGLTQKDAEPVKHLIFRLREKDQEHNNHR